MGSENKARGYTVQQSVQPPEKHVDIDVTVTVPGTAKTVLTYGKANTLGVVRAWSFVVDKDCYIELNGAATSASTPLKAGDQWWEENRVLAPDYATKAETGYISILNAVLGELPNIRGIVWGY